MPLVGYYLRRLRDRGEGDVLVGIIMGFCGALGKVDLPAHVLGDIIGWLFDL